MNKKQLMVYLLSLVLVIVCISFNIVYVVSSTELNVECWDTDMSPASSNLLTDWVHLGSYKHYGFPDAWELPNGNWLVAWGAGIRHGSEPATIDGMISTDHGLTWGSVFTIASYGVRRISDPVFGTTANGTVICFINGNTVTASQASYVKSFDNGTTWTPIIDWSVTWIHMFTDTRFYDGILYVTASNPYSTPSNATIWKTLDNGSTWQIHNTGTSLVSCDEGSFIKLQNGTWFSIWREYNSTAPKAQNGMTYGGYSEDGGVTWSLFNISSRFVVGCIQDPSLDWLNENQNILILHGRDTRMWSAGTCGVNNYMAYWISDDSGITWKNYTQLAMFDMGEPCGCGGSNGCWDGGYSGLINVDDHTVFLVWYNGSWGDNNGATYNGQVARSDIYGTFISDNTTYEEELQFVSIDGGINGTVIYNSTPTFKWVDTNSIKYNLQIATDFTFTTLVTNLTNISQVEFPTTFSTDGTNVTFILPTTYALTTYNIYFCRVRGYV